MFELGISAVLVASWLHLADAQVVPRQLQKILAL